MPIVSIVRAQESVDILELAGSSHVLHVPEMLGQALGLVGRVAGEELIATLAGQHHAHVLASRSSLAAWVLRDPSAAM